MKKILLLSHSTLLSGPIDYLESYLISKKAYSINKLTHPLDNYSNRSSEYYADGLKFADIKRVNFGPLSLLNDFRRSVFFLKSMKPDIIIAANNFDCLSAILYKRFSYSKIKIIYFASDFSEDRFANKILNRIYYFVEKKVLNGSNQVISNTYRAEKRRITLGLNPKLSTVIPNGVQLKSAKFYAKKINKNLFIYVGSVTKEHGLYELLETIKTIINELIIIGGGDDMKRVRSLCEENKLKIKIYENKSHDFVMKYLTTYTGFGLAPYNVHSRWTYYCSPLKVNEYIASGIPVLMSDVPEIAQYIESNKLGIVYNTLNKNDLINKLDNFETDHFNRKAAKFYTLFSYDQIYKKLKLNENKSLELLS